MSVEQWCVENGIKPKTYYYRLRKVREQCVAVPPSIVPMKLDPFSKSLFLFCGRRCDRIKGLLWEGDGYLLLYKRLDNGQFQWPRNETEAKLLTSQQTRWLLEGLSIEQSKAIKVGKPGAIY